MKAVELDRAQWVRGDRTGHYESFFLRANHPSRPLAFWIRYTIFSPRRAPEQARGELWAIWFDGEAGSHLALKSEIGADHCVFSRDELKVVIGDATLGPEDAQGSVSRRDRSVRWQLEYACDERPVLLMPERMYRAAFPRAKALVPAPMARFRGSIFVDGREFGIDDWVGSRNHNWGSRHTDSYAWGQVAGFDSRSDAFLEVATARVKVGPWLTPPATLLVLRMGSREHRVASLREAFRAKARVEGFTWTFATELREVALRGVISAPASSFVGLSYANPPGGTKHCLNTKIASCEIVVVERGSGNTVKLSCGNRAAFEILTDRRDHGIEIRA